MPSPAVRPLLPLLALAVLSLIWGYTWVLAKQGLDFAPPFAFAAARSAGGAASLLAVLLIMRKPLRPQAPWPTFGIGLTQVTGFLALQTWALVEGGPGKTAVLIFTMPIWTLILSRIFLGERLRLGQWLAALCTLGGLLLIIEPWELHTSPWSKLLGVAAALCWALGTVQVKHLRSRQAVDLFALTAWQLAIGCVPLVVLALLLPERATNWTWHYAAILGFMAIVSTGFCWWLWIWILDRVPAWEASLSILGTPVVAIASSRLLLGEAFHAAEMAGIALIGGGLALLSLLGWLAGRRAD